MPPARCCRAHGAMADRAEMTRMTHKADKQYGIEYNYGGVTWAMTIWADDEDDALRKLRAAATNGRVMGRIHVEIMLPKWTERIARWLRLIE